MADEKTEEKAQQQGTQQAAPQGKKKLSLLLIIIIVIAGLAITGGGAVTYLLLKGKPALEKQQEKDDKEKKKEEKGEKGTGGHVSKSEKQRGASAIKSIEPSFIVNLAGGTRTYLKVDMALELSDKKAEAEIDTKLPIIKDAIVLVLSEQTPESISDNKGKLRLKDELLRRINSHLTMGKVLNIYFTSFVVQ